MSHPPPDDVPLTPEQLDHVRHDVNNALTVMRGYTDLLQRRLERPGVVAAHDLPDVLAYLAAVDAAVSDVVKAVKTLDRAADMQVPGA